VDDQGGNLGVMPLVKALNLAEQKGCDLVEVAPTAQPPVCRLLDYGKFRYEQNKKERKTRKKVSELHQIRLRPKIEEHDMAFKVEAVRRFLEEGHKVRISVRFRGREQAHPELGRAVLERVFKALGESARAESPAVVEGRDMVVTIVPYKVVVREAKPAPTAHPPAAPPPPAATPAAKAP